MRIQYCLIEVMGYMVKMVNKAQYLICMAYFILCCWMAIPLSYVPWTFAGVILFASGLAGIEVSFLLLFISSKEIVRVLGFLVGMNGAVSACSWTLIASQGGIIVFVVLGMILFLYYSIYSLRTYDSSQLQQL